MWKGEIQSDWHQRGRESGYRGEDDNAKLAQIKKEYEDAYAKSQEAEKARASAFSQGKGYDGAEVIQEFRALEAKKQAYNNLANKIKSAVPDAPFKKTWHEMALRRLLKHAVDSGYEGLSWTGGAEQAERYDLSKQIESVSFTPVDAESSLGWLMATDKNGHSVIDEEIESDDLPDYIGKETAQKLKGESKGLEE